MGFLVDQAKSSNPDVALMAIRQLLAEKSELTPIGLRARFTSEHVSVAAIRTMPVDMARVVTAAIAESDLLEQIILRETRIGVRETACYNAHLTDTARVRLWRGETGWKTRDSHSHQLRYRLGKDLLEKLNTENVARQVWAVFPADDDTARPPMGTEMLRAVIRSLAPVAPEIVTVIVESASRPSPTNWHKNMMNLLAVTHPTLAVEEAARQGVFTRMFENHIGNQVGYSQWRQHAAELLAYLDRGVTPTSTYTFAMALSHLAADPEMESLRPQVVELAVRYGFDLTAQAYASLSDDLLEQVTRPLKHTAELGALLVERRWGNLERAWITAAAIADTFGGTPSEFLSVIEQSIG